MIHAIIATPEKEVFRGELKKIILTTSSGEIAVLRGHEPLISTIDAGHIIIEKEDGEREIFSGFNGIINIENNKGETSVKVLIESSENVKDLDEKALQEAIERAEKANTEKVDDLGLGVDLNLLKDMHKLKLARRYNR